jgi:hypothetical protein
VAFTRLWPSRRSRALTIVALFLATGCTGGFPRRVPGSDVTLPPPTRIAVLESLLGCATGVQTIAMPDNMGTCRSVTGDTVPDPRTVLPPPTKVP